MELTGIAKYREHVSEKRQRKLDIASRNVKARAERSSFDQFQKLDNHNGGPLVGAKRERKRLLGRLSDGERKKFDKFYGSSKLEALLKNE
jgi:hypothetical protein